MELSEDVLLILSVAVLIFSFLFGMAILSALSNITSKSKCSCSCKDCEYIENWAWVSEKEKDRVLYLLQALPLDTTEDPIEDNEGGR